MLTLTIVRHAKSSWSAPSLRDIERPLNARGKIQGQMIGTYLSTRKIDPDLIICSAAKRAQKTLGQLGKNWQTKAQINIESRLYLAAPNTLFKLLGEQDANHSHIMIIGHNPGLHTLANMLAHTGNQADLQILTQKFPTATLCVIQIDTDSWNAIEQSTGELKIFTTPKMLTDQQQ